MYILQDGRLYIQDGDKLVGVEIHSDKIIKVEGTETTLSDKYSLLTPFEVRAKFNITEGNGYIFPRPKQEPKVEETGVDKNGSDRTIKETSRKSTRK